MTSEVRNALPRWAKEEAGGRRQKDKVEVWSRTTSIELLLPDI